MIMVQNYPKISIPDCHKRKIIFQLFENFLELGIMAWFMKQAFDIENIVPMDLFNTKYTQTVYLYKIDYLLNKIF